MENPEQGDLFDRRISDEVKQKLDYWIEELQDVGKRNRLLFFKDTKTSSIVFTEPEISEIFQVVVDSGKAIYAPLTEDKENQESIWDSSPENEEDTNEYVKKHDEFLSNKSLKQLNRALNNLRYRSRIIREEQGFNALYLAIGLLKWRESSGGEFTEAPLILVPIDILREKLGSRMQIKMIDEDILVNPTLQIKLKNDFEIHLDEIPQGLDWEQLQGYFAKVSNLIQKHPGWEVQEKAAIGIFNFQSQMLIKDIENNSGGFDAHPIIQMLSGQLQNLLELDDDIPLADELDEKVNAENVFQILDADSSQQEAIEAAKRGASFVLQGPPGTGKSQTIANIIAESLAQGKKVLFVAQKSVALDVVHDRLTQKGLGDYCLEVHNHKKNKKDVINDLARSLVASHTLEQGSLTTQKRELQQLRTQINTYVQELHRPRFAINKSLFNVRGELAQLSTAPVLQFSISHLQTITVEDLNSRTQLIRELASYRDVIDNYEVHPWRGVTNQDLGTLQGKEDLEEKLRKTHEQLTIMRDGLQDVCTRINIPAPQTLEQHFALAETLNFLHVGVFSDESRDMVARFAKRYRSITRFLTSIYWKDQAAIKELLVREEKLGLKSIRRLTQTVLSLTAEEGLRTEVDAEGYQVDQNDVATWIKAQEQIQTALQYLSSIFTPNERPEVVDRSSTADMQIVIDWMKNQLDSIDRISDWLQYQKISEECREEDLAAFIEQALSNSIPPDNWQDAFKRRLFLLLSDEMVRSNQTLEKFRTSAHNDLIEQFRSLDNEIIKLNCREIQAKLNESKPEATWVKADSAETAILKKEVNKKRRFKPLRILFAEIPNLLLTLRPCLMMSPFTVSQLLDPEIYQFDIAIFDEASQIPPEYAIGTIMRSKQLVIAGDKKQLPPTTFFRTLDSDDSDDENFEIEDYESILNACDAINMPNKMLQWHYRSEDESLIAFSNYHFYDNRLLTFPTANADDPNTGLSYEFVPDGIYRKGKGARDNPIEARRVAELVHEHLTTSPELSLGIVTFSQSQRFMVEKELERLRRDEPVLYPLFEYNKDEHIFVKNLETVQGDERDVIIFSVGYGKDELGNMSMNFGPLNRQGGERRLNVAVTRARRAVRIVASFEPEDIDLSRTSSRGARLLRDYIKMARDGVASMYESADNGDDAEFGSPFEEAVYEALSQRELRIEKQVGVSKYRIDFGVVDPDKPGRYLLGIECDGATYHSSPTARDRDRLRQQLLEEKFGWRIHRIWSRDWINNSSKEIEKVLAAVEESKKLGPMQGVKKKAESRLEISDGQGELVEQVEAEFPSDSKPYKRTRFQRTGYRGAGDFYSIPRFRIIRAIENLVEHEGPLHRDVVQRRIAKTLNVKLGKKIAQELDYSITRAVTSKAVEERGAFLWPVSMKKPELRVHKPGNEKRKITEIPPEEIELAIIACVKNAVSISGEDLVRECLRLFGLRATKKNTRHIQPLVTSLRAQNEISRSLDKYHLPKKQPVFTPKPIPVAKERPGLAVSDKKRSPTTTIAPPKVEAPVEVESVVSPVSAKTKAQTLADKRLHSKPNASRRIRLAVTSLGGGSLVLGACFCISVVGFLLLFPGQPSMPIVTATAPAIATRTPVATNTLAPTVINTSTEPPRVEACVSANSLRVRAGPGIEYSLLGGLQFNECIYLDAVNPDRTWAKIEDEDQWVFLEFLDINGDIDGLTVAE